MHLRSTHDCMRGRRMNRNVRLSYAVIFHTLTSNIANFDLQTRATHIRCFSSGTYEYSWHFVCHAVRFSIYEAFNPIFPVQRDIGEHETTRKGKIATILSLSLITNTIYFFLRANEELDFFVVD